MSTIIIFLIVIIFLVVAHELGHFLVAKAFGIRVDEFGIGYPPRAKKLFTWRGTLFTLNWLPFGGFVKIYGEEPAAEGESVTENTAGVFTYQKLWKRALVIIAGILANTILAMVLYAISFGAGFLATPGDFPGSISVGPNETMITSVLDKSPASAAGFAAGDVITKLAVNTYSIAPADVTDAVAFIKAHSAEAITMTIVHNGSSRDVSVTPKAGVVGGNPGIGVTLTEVSMVRLPFWQAIKTGVSYTITQAGVILHTLGALVVSIFKGNGNIISQVSGPVGIAQFAGQAYSLGIGSFLSFVALISVNLAIINLLPFPALDGGRLVIEFFSSNGRSKIHPRVISAINQIGFILLILLMLYVTYHDITRLFA